MTRALSAPCRLLLGAGIIGGLDALRLSGEVEAMRDLAYWFDPEAPAVSWENQVRANRFLVAHGPRACRRYTRALRRKYRGRKW